MQAALHRILRSKSLPLWLLASLLVAHVATRLHLQAASSLARAHNYPRTYAVALSLLGGHGFADLAIDDSPSAAPLHEFLEMGRQRLSADELSRYFATVQRPERDPEHGLYAPLASTRVLDLRLAALLWRIFGVRWGVLSVFYCVLSTVTCALIFQIARRVSGSAWAGLAAAALFSCSPIEAFLTIWSWRDSSPMWFTAAALAWFVSRPASTSGASDATAGNSGNSATRRWLVWSAGSRAAGNDRSRLAARCARLAPLSGSGGSDAALHCSARMASGDPGQRRLRARDDRRLGRHSGCWP